MKCVIFWTKLDYKDKIGESVACYYFLHLSSTVTSSYFKLSDFTYIAKHFYMYSILNEWS